MFLLFAPILGGKYDCFSLTVRILLHGGEIDPVAFVLTQVDCIREWSVQQRKSNYTHERGMRFRLNIEQRTEKSVSSLWRQNAINHRYRYSTSTQSMSKVV